ncbi:hypothetical protein SGPA1_41214 [Streptomyces misionensis JCM 4497]
MACRGARSQLGYGVQLGTVRFPGTFLDNRGGRIRRVDPRRRTRRGSGRPRTGPGHRHSLTAAAGENVWQPWLAATRGGPFRRGGRWAGPDAGGNCRQVRPVVATNTTAAGTPGRPPDGDDRPADVQPPSAAPPAGTHPRLVPRQPLGQSRHAQHNDASARRRQRLTHVCGLYPGSPARGKAPSR